MKYLALTCLSLIWLSACVQPEKQDDQSENQASAREAIPFDDVIDAYPDAVQVRLKNQYVQVSEIQLAPGDSLPLHEGQPRAVYSLSDYRIAWQEGADQPFEDKSWQKGEVHFHAAQAHALRNVGTQPAHFLVVERRADDLPACEELDAGATHPPLNQDLFTLRLENEQMKVMEVRLAAGDSIPPHDGLNRAIYSLASYQTRFASSGREMDTQQFTPGDVHWHEGCRHRVVNNGETEAQFVVFALKP